MESIYLKLTYNVKDGKFEVEGDAKYPEELVLSFLHTQIGAGVDDTQAEEREEYTILIKLDLSGDVFSASDNCGNKGLRDGILLHFCRE